MQETLFEALGSNNDKIRRVFNTPDDDEKYKDNLVKLVVYYQEFNYERIYEVAAYQVWTIACVYDSPSVAGAVVQRQRIGLYVCALH